MKKFIAVALGIMMLTGCSKLNTTNYYDKSGKLVKQETASDDARYYKNMGEFLNAPCPVGTDPNVCVMSQALRVMAIRDISRGMNDNELIARITDKVDTVIWPLAVLEISKASLRTPRAVTLDNGSNYNVMEVTGTNNNPAVPFMSPPTTTTISNPGTMGSIPK